jgi:tRNA-specific 2-thiouridylase
MSGGVDSSVAAAMLVQEGADVVGLSMQLYDQSGAEQTFGRCCTLDDLHDARRVAAALGFPHYILNLERQFQETVVDTFVGEYLAGRTPIPCTHCNTDLKFATLLDRARAFGAEQVATGHYARIDADERGAWRLRRAVDEGKDQSYFLFGLTQDQLGRARFPLGTFRKDTVRELARRIGLQTADKPDSQELCFIPDGDHAAFITRRVPEARREGFIVDEAGSTLGTHDGVHRFTVGQRRGLGLSTGQPLYVTRIDSARQAITVGPRASLEQRTLSASGVNWIAGHPPSSPRVLAQIRHRHAAAAATLDEADGDRLRLSFDEPQVAVSPGQAVVVYEDDIVLGGGWID